MFLAATNAKPLIAISQKNENETENYFTYLFFHIFNVV
jgi:hypothetical protein